MATKFVSVDKLALFLDKIKLLIPTKTSQITNDSNFPSDANYVHTDNNFTNDLKTKLDNIASGANQYTLPTASADTKGGIKVGSGLSITDEVLSVSIKKTSQLTNDGADGSDPFITKVVNDLTNYYKKSETYTKTEVDNKIAAIKTITLSVVETLPATGQSNVIYLVPKKGGSGTNVKDEYLWTGTAFEKIGDTSIDLSGYWAKADLVEATNDEINALFN